MGCDESRDEDYEEINAMELIKKESMNDGVIM